jgi:hypothetical protein
MESEKKSTHQYDVLPDQMYELAYAENELFNLRQVQAERERLIRERKDEILSFLTTTDGIEHDTFLQHYQEMLLLTGNRTQATNAFPRMLEIRDQLTPGTHLYNRNFGVRKITPPEGSDDPNFGITPVLTYSESEREYALNWRVPTGEESVTTVNLNDEVAIGAEAIKKRLGYEEEISRSERSVNFEMYEIGVVSRAHSYEQIGEVETAENLRRVTVTNIRSHIDKLFDASGSYFSGESYEIGAKLWAIQRLDPEYYQGILSRAQRSAAAGKDRPVVEAIFEHDLRDGPNPLSARDPLGRAERYVEFIRRGLENPSTTE